METTFLALFFISLAAGMTVSSCRYISKLGQYTCVLICSLVVGWLASKCLGVDFSRLRSTMDSLKSLLFLLFIFATGYTNGPAIFVLCRKLKSRSGGSRNAAKIVSVGLVVFAVALLTVLCIKRFLKDDSLLGAVTAGALTQTAILGLTADAVPGAYSRGINREVVFTLTYLMSTVATMFFCTYIIPRFSKIFGRKLRDVKTEDILSKSAEELIEADDGKAISFKLSPVPDRVGRAFVVKEKTGCEEYGALKKRLAEHHMTIQAVFGAEGKIKDLSDGISPGDIVVVLGERRSMAVAAEIVGDEKLDIPRQWQKNFKFASMSLFLTAPNSLREIRNVCDQYDMCIEQIIDPDGNDVVREGDAVLSRGTKIKLFGVKRDMYEIAEKLDRCFVIPKDRNTGIALLSFCIFSAIMLAMIPGVKMIGSGLFAFLFGIAIGCFREYSPRKYFGFPPQASQLFQTFGLGGYLAISGLGAADKIMNVSSDGLGIVLLVAAAIWALPLLCGMAAALRLFGNNAAISAVSVAGARSSNVAYEDVSQKCAGNGRLQLETAFSISYAVANIFLTLIGILI